MKRIISIDDIKSKIPQILEQVPYLKILVLFGSRARGTNSDETSDWDFALLFDEDLRQQYEQVGEWDCYRSGTILQQLLSLGDDEMDWIDLKNASEFLTHEIARDGVVLYEQEAGIFQDFQRSHLKGSAELREISLSLRQKTTQKLQQLRT